MTGTERRLEPRIPIDMFLNQYVKEHPYRALALDLSESGLSFKKLVEPVARHSRVMGLEFELPGTGEVIWVRGESRFDSIDEDFHATGILFTAMARKHERLVRDYVYDKQRQRLGSLWLRLRLAKIAQPLV